ncbi:hypothetical protein HYH03_008491 [Edaphochlamys debaryana]|uniref:Uncharacterized protein n=1 Tax=Edaphochlamys debaryana TaxID=47281 RepID=A0A835Y2A1_9CHLO|nr:hypothetical protein HYH03_008491 [Edaphochlamys debaryana]|eukprot:KAG2493358.1 hypothetical protein HYH03_008491 [Edaphochlamys debaryana]
MRSHGPPGDRRGNAAEAALQQPTAKQAHPQQATSYKAQPHASALLPAVDPASHGGAVHPSQRPPIRKARPPPGSAGTAPVSLLVATAATGGDAQPVEVSCRDGQTGSTAGALSRTCSGEVESTRSYSTLEASSDATGWGRPVSPPAPEAWAHSGKGQEPAEGRPAGPGPSPQQLQQGQQQQPTLPTHPCGPSSGTSAAAGASVGSNGSPPSVSVSKRFASAFRSLFGRKGGQGNGAPAEAMLEAGGRAEAPATRQGASPAAAAAAAASPSAAPAGTGLGYACSRSGGWLPLGGGARALLGMPQAPSGCAQRSGSVPVSPLTAAQAQGPGSLLAAVQSLPAAPAPAQSHRSLRPVPDIHLSAPSYDSGGHHGPVSQSAPSPLSRLRRSTSRVTAADALTAPGPRLSQVQGDFGQQDRGNRNGLAADQTPVVPAAGLDASAAAACLPDAAEAPAAPARRRLQLGPLSAKRNRRSRVGNEDLLAPAEPERRVSADDDELKELLGLDTDAAPFQAGRDSCSGSSSSGLSSDTDREPREAGPPAEVVSMGQRCGPRRSATYSPGEVRERLLAAGQQDRPALARPRSGIGAETARAAAARDGGSAHTSALAEPAGYTVYANPMAAPTFSGPGTLPPGHVRQPYGSTAVLAAATMPHEERLLRVVLRSASKSAAPSSSEASVTHAAGVEGERRRSSNGGGTGAAAAVAASEADRQHPVRSGRSVRIRASPFTSALDLFGEASGSSRSAAGGRGAAAQESSRSRSGAESAADLPKAAGVRWPDDDARRQESNVPPAVVLATMDEASMTRARQSADAPPAAGQLWESQSAGSNVTAGATPSRKALVCFATGAEVGAWDMGCAPPQPPASPLHVRLRRSQNIRAAPFATALGLLAGGPPGAVDEGAPAAGGAGAEWGPGADSGRLLIDDAAPCFLDQELAEEIARADAARSRRSGCVVESSGDGFTARKRSGCGMTATAAAAAEAEATAAAAGGPPGEGRAAGRQGSSFLSQRSNSLGPPRSGPPSALRPHFQHQYLHLAQRQRLPNACDSPPGIGPTQHGRRTCRFNTAAATGDGDDGGTSRPGSEAAIGAGGTALGDGRYYRGNRLLASGTRSFAAADRRAAEVQPSASGSHDYTAAGRASRAVSERYGRPGRTDPGGGAGCSVSAGRAGPSMSALDAALGVLRHQRLSRRSSGSGSGAGLGGVGGAGGEGVRRGGSRRRRRTSQEPSGDGREAAAAGEEEALA